MEGALELAAGLLFSATIAALLVLFSMSVLGAMMLLVGMELAKGGRELRVDWALAPALATVAGTLTVNMAVGFARLKETGSENETCMHYALPVHPGP